jgi:hypothetical protein
VLTNVVTVVLISIIVIIEIIAQVFDWSDRLEKHPRIKKFVEAKILRVSLLLAAVCILAPVWNDLDKIRKELNNPPPRQAPPLPITFTNSVVQTSNGSGSPNVNGVHGDVTLHVDQSGINHKVDKPRKKQ